MDEFVILTLPVCLVLLVAAFLLWLYSLITGTRSVFLLMAGTLLVLGSVFIALWEGASYWEAAFVLLVFFLLLEASEILSRRKGGSA